MKASTIFLVFLGLSVAGIGILFTWLMWGSYQRASDQRAWPQVEASILESQVEESRPNDFSPNEYRLQILYGYQWKNKAMTGERYGYRGNPRYKNRARIEALVREFPANSTTKIYVNPADPKFTILAPDSKAAGYSIWFPVLFIIGGLGISIRAILKLATSLADSA